MSDDARQLIDNPYRASHTPIIAGDVNVTDLMARAWDRGFAAGDERLRAMLGKVPREQLGRIMQEVAATPNAPKADVRRWTPAYGPNGSCCYENENGDYVLARDYDDLAAASPDERLREAARHLREKADQLRPSDSFPESAAFQNFRGWLGAADELDRLAAAARDTPDDSPDLGCPDGGTCHHNCGDYAGPPFHCWRVHNAAPLSMYGEAWPTPLPHAVVLPVNEPETNT